MENTNLETLIRVLQASISPVALISGVGLLILSLTNRFSRVTDRLRELISHRRAGTPVPSVEKQISIFLRRARILRASISCAVFCVFLASLLVLVLFGVAVANLPLLGLVVLLFALSLIGLVVSVALFLRDMHLSLRAVQEELAGSEEEQDFD